MNTKPEKFNLVLLTDKQWCEYVHKQNLRHKRKYVKTNKKITTLISNEK
jgi:hypothetical protein